MKRVFYIILCAISLSAQAQNKMVADSVSYPQDYFRNPLDIPIFLAGNFGECRPGHFHSGVDIKTLGKEGQPVHAAADGYISRIKMEKGGFGHGIYITHPNGYTTLYAHLSDFMPAIQDYVKKEQYKQKRWDVDLQISPDQFPVKKGQQIAWSGNTGASTAPHLHFEIRNTKTEHPLNPELFGLPIIDNIAPLPTEVAIYETHRFGVGEYGFYEAKKIFIPLKKNDTIYTLGVPGSFNTHDYVNGDTLTLNWKGDIGIGINVNDYMNGSDNTIAFHIAKLFFDGKLQTEITLDDIGYDETRYINAYADYKTRQQENKWIQCLFKLPGNHLDQIYTYLNDKQGRLVWDGDGLHKINISLIDDKGNESSIVFFVRSENAGPGGTVGDGPAGLHFRMLRVDRQNVYDDPDGLGIRFTLNDKALYDNINLETNTANSPGNYSDKKFIGYPYIPVHTYFELSIFATKAIPIYLQKKVVMMYTDDKDVDGRAAIFEANGWYRANVRNFGTYWLDIDTTAPVIDAMQKSGANLSRAKQITFDVKDDKTSVKSFSGYLDGKWICFEQHGDSFFYKFDEHCPKGKHKLVFKAEDENGNVATNNLTFTR